MTETFRRLSYVSQSSSGAINGVPAELASIVIRSRSFNHARSISGFLTYRRGFYFQVIEGTEAEVEALFQKICHDSRHHDITMVWDDHAQSSRFFTGWKLKLSSSSATCEEVGEFLRSNQHRLNSLDPETLGKIRTIFQLDLILCSLQGHLPTDEEFVESQLRLQALPSTYSLVSENPSAIELFTVMLNHWITPRELSQQFGVSYDELYKLLTNARVKPLLLRRNPQDRTSHSLTGVAGSDQPNAKSFYQSLRSFFMVERR